MAKFKDDGESYLTMYPKLMNWISECRLCHFKLYNPKILDDINFKDETLAKKNLKKYFPLLELNDDGVCSQCEKTLDRERIKNENKK